MFESLKGKFQVFIALLMSVWASSQARGMEFGRNKAGAGMIGKLIGLSVGVFIMVYTIPPAISALYNVSVATWGTEVGTLFTILVPLLIVVAVVIVILKYVGIKVDM